MPRKGERPHDPTWLLPILALAPRLGLSVIAADRQQVTPEARALLLWWSSAAFAVLVGPRRDLHWRYSNLPPP